MTLPAGARRLFPGYDPDELAAPGFADFVIARLCEDGDSADCAWLASRWGEERLARWLARSGGRALSPRSRAFWQRVLATSAGRPAAASRELWPPW